MDVSLRLRLFRLTLALGLVAAGILIAWRLTGPWGSYVADLPELQEHGVLRVTVPPEPIAFLPREAEPVGRNRAIARGLADALGLELRLIPVADRLRMLELLREGDADIIAADLTRTPSRREHVEFSRPYRYVDELLIVPEGAGIPTSLEGLAGVTVCVRTGTSYAETLERLREEGIGVEIRRHDPDTATDRIVEVVAEGGCPATVVDSHLWQALAPEFPRLTVSVRLERNRPIALALHPDAERLGEAVDNYLTESALTGHREDRFTDDLPGLRERGRLRMITRNNAATYFIHRGKQVGFEYDLLKRYANGRGLQLDVVIPAGHDALIDALLEGRGDVIAAAMTVTPERARRVTFTRPYMTVEELVVVRPPMADEITRPADLADRTVAVRSGSSYEENLEDLRRRLDIALEIERIEADVETEEILAGVEAGRWDISVADSHIFAVERNYGLAVSAPFALTSSNLAWAVRPDNPELLADLNRYLSRSHRGLHYNMARRRYFEQTAFGDHPGDPERPTQLSTGRISPWDDLLRRYGARYDLDWRLLASLMYQESRFDPDRVSWAGAVGLMQLMPRTGRELGISPERLRSPERSIEGGARYLRRMIDRFSDLADPEMRIRLGLASYNAGHGHIADARRVARRLGRPDDEWAGALAEILVWLERRPDVYRFTRYGYCRCTEAVQYVEQIIARYDAYASAIPLRAAAE